MAVRLPLARRVRARGAGTEEACTKGEAMSSEDRDKAAAEAFAVARAGWCPDGERMIAALAEFRRQAREEERARCAQELREQATRAALGNDPARANVVLYRAADAIERGEKGGG
jgi:hypothetical protein